MNYIKFVNYLNNISLKKFLKDNCISMRAYKDLIKDGILVNDKLVYKNISLKEKDVIKIPIEDEDYDYEPIKGKLKIVYEDDNIIVSNKNCGITVNSKNQVSLANHIAYYFREENIRTKIRLINRLDMNTSGLMMVAKNKYAQAFYQKQIEENLITKKYLAYVEGKLDIDKLYKIKLSYDEDNKLNYENKDGKEAITYFRTINSNDKYSLIECDIKTGKTHQIRASLNTLGHPILGDMLYGSKYKLERFLLHSYFLKFNEFMSEESIILKDYPDFKPFLENLWKYLSWKKV